MQWCLKQINILDSTRLCVLNCKAHCDAVVQWPQSKSVEFVSSPCVCMGSLWVLWQLPPTLQKYALKAVWIFTFLR